MRENPSPPRPVGRRPSPWWTTHQSELVYPKDLILAGVHVTESEACLLAGRGLLAHIVHSVYSTSMPSPELRGHAVGLHLRPASRQNVTVHRLTAAWIYGCAPTPDCFECSVGGSSGHHFDDRELPYVSHRYTSYSKYEIVPAGPVTVTTPLRTCVDLAVSDGGNACDNALATLMRAPVFGCAPPVVVAALRAVPRLRGRDRAIRRVEDLSPGER